MDRRSFAAGLAVLGMPWLARAAGGDSWPKGPITLVVPLAAGDGGDTSARVMAEALSHELQVPVVVTNRPGAGGALGVQSVIAAKRDGYTLLFTQNSPLTIRRVLEPQAAAYDPLRELMPLGISTRTPSVLVVRKDGPMANFHDLVVQARRTPGSIRIGNAGPGSAGDLSVQVVNTIAGTKITSIPYKGAAPAVTDVLGGQVEAVILALGAVAGHIKSGTLKALAISNPYSELPEVPTLTRLGYRQDLLGVWFAFLAPAGTPPEVSQVLLPALQKVVADPAVAKRLLPLGIVQQWEPAASLVAEITSEYQTVTQLAQRMGPKKP
jgi:tripartite-type tricarboxylate transporter receptor subunit TctC